MKKVYLFIIAIIALNDLALAQIDPEQMLGAWNVSSPELNDQGIDAVIILAPGYFSRTHYSLEGKKFILTYGGAWEIKGNIFEQSIEYDTKDPDNVGGKDSYSFEMKDNQIQVVSSNEIWKRMDDGQPGKLAGAWLITGREREGKMTKRTPGPRKTMKILSGTRFQWIAYNVDTKQFMGTGGGTYTTIDGKYTENIDFFSRDSTRVGASLVFDYVVIDGNWHHKGKSSKGKPIYEIWSLR